MRCFTYPRVPSEYCSILCTVILTSGRDTTSQPQENSKIFLDAGLYRCMMFWIPLCTVDCAIWLLLRHKSSPCVASKICGQQGVPSPRSLGGNATSKRLTGWGLRSLLLSMCGDTLHDLPSTVHNVIWVRVSKKKHREGMICLTAFEGHHTILRVNTTLVSKALRERTMLSSHLIQ